MKDNESEDRNFKDPIHLSLNELVEKAVNKVISLPAVQRGFIWKPYQIENLWDSLLRAYPIGSFVVSRKVNDAEGFELLDGQQRASAICLGFFNPLTQSVGSSDQAGSFFHTSTENIMIFIDLADPPKNDSRKYIIRVITKSHPWGYRRNDNQKTLESNNIAEAMKIYNLSGYDYLKKPLASFWPYDSINPVPLGIFIESALKDLPVSELINSIEKWRAGRNLKSKNKSVYTVDEIYFSVKQMLNIQKIPILHLDIEKIYESSIKNDDNPTIINENENKIAPFENEEITQAQDEDLNSPDNEDKTADEIENLFIRLNSGGTPLKGEELNYSILKSHLRDEQSKKIIGVIEERCKGLFNPARFITIAFRLYMNQRMPKDKDSTSMKIKPKQFQRAIKKEKEPFILFIEKSLLQSDILKQFKSILTYDKNTNYNALPAFIVNTLADQAPELVFMLFYRLMYKKDKDNITEDIKRRILGMVTLLLWLGKGEKRKDYRKLLSAIWPCVKYFETDEFWSKETLQRALVLDDNEYEIMTPFPEKIPKNFNENNIRNLAWSKITDCKYGNFIKKMFFEPFAKLVKGAVVYERKST